MNNLTLSTALETALNRIEDMLAGDDGQAFKEARKFLPVGRAALAAQPGSVGEPIGYLNPKVLNDKGKINVNNSLTWSSRPVGGWTLPIYAAAPTEEKPAQQDAVDAEPKSLNAKIADQLRPFLKPGDKVIWREAFRWHDDNGVMPNHYDGMSIAGLADEFGYRFDWDFNMNHAAIIQGAALNASKEQP